MIEVRALSKSYGGHKAVDNISFTLERGKILVLIGPSGCGKTTTMKMINRLIEPDSGEVFINNKEIRDVDPVQLRRQTGYVIQQNNLFPHYTVRQNILVVPKLLKKMEQNLAKRMEEVLRLVDLPGGNFLDKYPGQLSGGQQQRVAIARAVMAQPPLLLMDEPFSALDLLTRTGVRANFQQLAERLNTTAIIVTHDIAEAVLLANRLCLMNNGQVMQVGSPAELIFQPSNDFVKSFFNHNRFDLEMQVTSIADLLPFLNINTTNDGEVLKINQKDRLFAVLNKLAENGLKSVEINWEKQEPVYTNQRDLMNAFYEFKAQKAKKQ